MKRIKFYRTPNCSTPEQFREWMTAARGAAPGKAGFCEDCTEKYASKMRACGKCEHPEVMFDENGGFVPSGVKVSI